MTKANVHVLLVYSHSQKKLVSQDEFSDSAKATKAYADVERDNMRNNDYEIVLIGSDSIETIMKTHGHYFAGEFDLYPMELNLSA